MSRIKWTFEACREEALKYNKKYHFKVNSISAYIRALKNDWLDEICSHMIISKQLPSGYWTFEKCQIEALKYSTRSEFIKGCQVAYNKARLKGWLNTICSHMELKKRINNYWTYDRCREEALKYTNHKEFFKNSSGAVCASRKGGWV